jgi:thiamine biosynthesis protein ThiS
MKITLNGDLVEIENNYTLEDVVKYYKLDKRKIAIEKNMEIISRSSYQDTKIEEGDEVEIIHFIGGG